MGSPVEALGISQCRTRWRANTRRALPFRPDRRPLRSGAGRLIAVCVCRFMRRQLESRRGAPAIVSRNGVVRLWRVERFEDVSWAPSEPWVLDDGVKLDPAHSVLEFHIAADRFLELLH